jgi:hypothetical protein
LRDSTNARKRAHKDADDEDDDEEGNDGGADELAIRRGRKVYKFHKKDLGDIGQHLALELGLTEKQEENWSKVSVEAQNQCVKAVVRMLVTAGSRKEPLTRAKVLDCVSKVNADYKKHASKILVEAHKHLHITFGYSIITGDKVKGTKKGKKDDLYVINDIQSPALLELLAMSSHDDAFMGFCFIVFQAIYSSPGKRIKLQDVMSYVREVDKRFPTTCTKSSSKGRSSLPIPELGDDFLGLINRMKKRGYVNLVKTQKEKGGQDANNDMLQTCSFGVRFFAEIGQKRLMRAYFASKGENVDEALMREIEEEEAEEEEEEEEGGEDA